MEQKKIILGLDLGVNTIGWALVERDVEGREGRIIDMGVRVIPMDKTSRDNFSEGKGLSQAQERRMFRSARRNNQRYKMRRDKLVLVLDALGWMPDDIGYAITERKPGIPQVTIMPLKRSDDYREKEKGEAKREHTAMRVYELRAHGRKRAYDDGKELGRVLYLLNQWRGYQDIGMLNEEEKEKEKELAKAHEHPIHALKILDTRETAEVYRAKGKKSKIDRKIWEVTVEGATTRHWTVSLCKWWKDKTMDFQMIAQEDGSNELRLSGQTKWAKTMEQNEKDLGEQLIGEKLYALLLKAKDQYAPPLPEKRYTRQRYKEEFKGIWEHQAAQPGWATWMTDCPIDRLSTIAKLLYPLNADKQTELVKKGLLHVIRDEIIYYQRPLKKPQRQLSCPKEPFRILPDGSTRPNRPAPKSHPLFQEYRLWQQVQNMAVKSISQEAFNLTEEHRVALFEFLANTKKAEPKDVLKKVFGLDPERYELRIEDLDTERTLAAIRPALKEPKKRKKTEEAEADDKATIKTAADATLAAALREPYANETSRLLYTDLWHLLHTAGSSKAKQNALTGRDAHLKKPKEKKDADELLSADFIVALCKEPFEKGYAGYSQRALAKVVPLMRAGKYFREETIPAVVRERIEKVINAVDDETIGSRTREKFAALSSISDYRGLMAPDALELVYGSHAPPPREASWKKPSDVKVLQRGKLRHPVVEGVINEALLVVRDLWLAQQKENGKEWKYDEVVVEFARDLKNSNKEKEKFSEQNKTNRDTNDKAREKVRELLHREARLGEIERYKLWEEQGKKCMYSRETITCTDLFKPMYEIDHIVPRSRRFDDSYGNKVLCLALLNKDKGNSLPLVWFNRSSIYKRSTLEEFTADAEAMGKGKRTRLLALTVEDGHIERQMKETQYIVRGTVEQLGNLVGSANVRSTSGGITSYLRGEWEVDGILREANLWRYERLERILQERLGAPLQLIHEENGKKIISGWSKRIDHRNHALDALVVACTRQQHITYLNTLNRLKEDNPELHQHLRNDLIERKKEKNRMRAPWQNFRKDANDAFEGIITSIKVAADPVVKKKGKYRVAERREGRNTKSRWRSQPKHIAVLDELHLQPDGWIWRHTHKTAYDVLGGLKDLEATGMKALLTERMPVKADREALLTLLADNEWNIQEAKTKLGKPKAGKAKKVDDVVYKERWVVARAALKDLKDKHLKPGKELIVDRGLVKQINAWLAKTKLPPEEAFAVGNLEAFNGERQEYKLPPVYKVRVYESLLDGNTSRVLLDRTNSFNDRLVVTKKKSFGVLLGERNVDGKRTDRRITLFSAAASATKGAPIVPDLHTENGYFLRVKQMVAVIPKESSWDAFIREDRREQAARIYRFSNPQDQLQFQPHFFTDEMVVKSDDHKAIAKGIEDGTINVEGAPDKLREYKKQLAKLKKPGIGEFFEGKEGHTRTLDESELDITKSCVPLIINRIGRIVGPNLVNGKA